MSITGPGSITALNIQTVNNMNNQLNTLSTELGTNQAAQTYSGLGSQAGVALALNAQLSAINSYSATATTVGTTLTVAQSTLTQLGSSGSSVEQAINQQGAFSLNNNGQTTVQAGAAAQLDEVLSLLNTQVGSNYMFSGSATTQPSVASASDILNGNGTQAGLTQVIAQRLQADQGANGLGAPGHPGRVGLGRVDQRGCGKFAVRLQAWECELVADWGGRRRPVGFARISLGQSRLQSEPGDSIAFDLTLPDGSTQTITLQATTASPAGANQFTIGATPSDTATNLQAALTTAVGTLDQTALPAASAMAASNNFFSSNPPLRVAGPPYDTATSLVNGTPANTVFWYTGENGSTPARHTATAQVGPSMSIAYGMRANEQAITTLVSNVAVLAATTYSASNPNAGASYQALSNDVAGNLDGKPGTQTVSDIEADLANAQTTVADAGKLNTQTQSTLQDMMQNIDGVNQNQIGEQILTLQNSLSASLSVTARMAQISLVNFLAPSSG